MTVVRSITSAPSARTAARRIELARKRADAADRTAAAAVLRAMCAEEAAAAAEARAAAAERELDDLAARVFADPLTGVLNREGIGHEFEHGPTAAVLFVDLDKFKPVNDQYGHAAGNEVLRAVAGRLDGVDDCIAGRLGGDEFVVLYRPQRLVRDRDVAIIAEHVAQAIALPIQLWEHGPVVQVAGSIGSTVVEPGEGLPEVLARADRAMYRSKMAGRPVAWRDGMRMPSRGDRAGRRIKAATA